ncbi:MAG: alpha/beta hydrolase [Armatimonadota bacterium]
MDTAFLLKRSQLVRGAFLIGAATLTLLALGYTRPAAAQRNGAPRRNPSPVQIQPTGPRPEWAPTIDPQMQAVVEQLEAFHAPPLTELTAVQARETPTATDAVDALLMKTGHPPMPSTVEIGHRVLPVGPEDGMLVRTYTPRGAAEPLPVIVYYHGGGWAIANLGTYEPSARALAEKTGAMVVSVAYRQAPEHRFPTAHEDSFAAYQWITENADELGADPNRIAVAGESAGGNLAVAVALRAREQGVRPPIHILAVYPIADGDTESASYDEYAEARPLNRPMMQWFFDQYLEETDDAQNPWISLVDADLNRLPTTTILNAEIDPLRSDGEELAQRMRSAGVSVQQRTYPGVTHEFFGMSAVLDQADQAQDLAAQRLRQSFGTQTTRTPTARPTERVLGSRQSERVRTRRPAR